MATISGNAEINSIRLREQAAAPATPAVGYVQVYTKADGKLYRKADDGVEAEVGASPSPNQADIFGDTARVITGGALINTYTDPNQTHMMYSRQSPSATGDAREWTFYLAAGTYIFTVVGITNTSYGIVGWTLDGAAIVTGQDWFGSSLVYNVVKTTTAISVATSGLHTLRATINGKNASSTAHEFFVTKVMFRL